MRRCHRWTSVNKMSSSSIYLVRTAKNPDDDFVLHGRSASYWERDRFLNNSKLTLTTSRLSQHSFYNPDNYREKKHERKHATSLSDLANNLEALGDEVDLTLNKSVTFKTEDELLEDEIRRELREQVAADLHKPNLSAFSRPVKLTETLKSDVSEEELLGLYEKHVGSKSDAEELSGKLPSPRDAQWYVNPNHLDTTVEAPTQQSIGRTYRYGDRFKEEYSDKDKTALDYFPVTLGSAYDMCALNYPASEPLRSTAPPSMRLGCAKSPTTKLTKSPTFRLPDRSFKESQDLDKLYLMTQEAPTIGSSSVAFSTPHQLILGKLRLERLRLEEAKLLELKRLEELERIRGPKPRWYMSKGPEFHYESRKNTKLIRSVSDYQDMLDYREDLLRSSYHNLKKFNKSLVLA